MFDELYSSCFQEPGFWRERQRQRRREREIGLAFQQLGNVTDCEAKCVLQSRELMVRSLQTTTTLILARAFTRHSRQHASSSHTADEGGAATTRGMKSRTREVDE